MKRLLSVLVVFLMGAISVLPQGGAQAELGVNEADFFSQNNILFYDPTGDNPVCRTTFNLGAVEASGEYNENAVFVMAYLTKMGFSVTSAAAIVGNLKAESGSFNPGEGEDGRVGDVQSGFRLTTGWSCYNRCGFGIAQWTSGGRQLALQSFADAQGMEVTSIELQTMFLAHELEQYGYSAKALNALSIEEATFVIYDGFEKPGSSFWTTNNGTYYNNYDPKTIDQLSESATPAAYREFTKRLSFVQGAQKVMQENNISATQNVETAASNTQDGADVTIIGDSITVRAHDDILALIPKAEIFAQVSKQFYQGGGDNPGGYEILTDLVNKKTLRKTLIYALGTNSEITLAQAKAVMEAVGQDAQVIFVNNYGVSEHDYTANNNVMAEIARQYENASVANWNAAVSEAPEKYMDDDVHPKMGEGTKLFAKTIVAAIGETTSLANADLCDEGGGGNYAETTATIGGNKYVFPLLGATKANYLNPGGKAGESWLSRLPCGSGNICHHDYAAVDMGLRKKLVDGKEYTASDFSGSGGSFSPIYYYSTGVKVLAFVDGKITNYHYYRNGVPADYVEKCASVTFQGNDGVTYWIGHMSYDPKIKAGDTFKAGEVIGEVGPPPCAQSTQSHLHINTMPYSRSVIDIMDQLYEKLPEK